MAFIRIKYIKSGSKKIGYYYLVKDGHEKYIGKNIPPKLLHLWRKQRRTYTKTSKPAKPGLKESKLNQEAKKNLALKLGFSSWEKCWEKHKYDLKLGIMLFEERLRLKKELD